MRVLYRPGKLPETGNHIEQFFINAALAQTMEGAMELLQQVIDVLIGTFHRRQAAGILTRKRFRASPEQGDE